MAEVLELPVKNGRAEISKEVKMKLWAGISSIAFLVLVVGMDPISLRSVQSEFSNHLPISGRKLAQSDLTYMVDRLTDTDPTGGGEGLGLTGDLRYSIINAQSGDRIVFSITGTINLSGSLPPLTQSITIQGMDGLIVSGEEGSVFFVNSGAHVVISNLTITGGMGNGGGVLNKGTLMLNNVTISGNTAGDPTNGGGTGAGIWNDPNGDLTLNNSTISDNTALGNSSYNPSRGGGIANYGTLTLNNSTVSGNSALEGSGGGISNTLPASTLTLNNSTISDNSAIGALGNGSGIDNLGKLHIRNTIIAGNLDDDVYGIFTSEGHNLIGNATGGSGFRPDLGDLLNLDPLLGPLGDNGGPTPIHALLQGSPAIDADDNATCASEDQRGVFRPQDGNQDGTTTCDIGAYEFDDIPSKATVTPVPIDTLTPTLTSAPLFTATPTIDVTEDVPARTPTATPVPPRLPCSSAAILVILSIFLMRLRLR